MRILVMLLTTHADPHVHIRVRETLRRYLPRQSSPAPRDPHHAAGDFMRLSMDEMDKEQADVDRDGLVSRSSWLGVGLGSLGIGRSGEPS